MRTLLTISLVFILGCPPPEDREYPPEKKTIPVNVGIIYEYEKARGISLADALDRELYDANS